MKVLLRASVYSLVGLFAFGGMLGAVIASPVAVTLVDAVFLSLYLGLAGFGLGYGLASEVAAQDRRKYEEAAWSVNEAARRFRRQEGRKEK